MDILRLHAHNRAIFTKGPIWLLCLWGLLSFSACHQKDSEAVDRLNMVSYDFHYRNLDSVRVYAEKALRASSDYDDGHAEAMNNLAFYYTSKMKYKQASSILDSVSLITDNQVELLIANVQQMRLCQRMSANKDFYDYHEEAQRRLHRIEEEKGTLSKHQQLRYIYARSEFNIVTSTYYYYVGLERQSVDALRSIDPDGDIQKDTAQYLNYLYNVGAGGIITEGTQDDISQQEFDYLTQCYFLALKFNYPFWQANTLEAISEHLQSTDERRKLIEDNGPAVQLINTDRMPDSLLAGNLALRSLDLFTSFGDIYQIAGANRTLASCYWQIKDYNSAIACLQDALEKDTAINQAPDLVASIREQLSIVYSSVNDKQQSDYNRNIYLDLQEQTRQDRYYESRADQLAKSSSQLNLMILSVIVMIVIVVLLLLIFNRLRRRNDRRNSLSSLLEPLQLWQKRYNEYMDRMNDKYEDINEAYSLSAVHIVSDKKRNLEQRAKISLVNSIVPFIDRMLNEIDRLITRHEPYEVRKERYEYIAELTDKINEYNTVLTDWIQVRQGQLNLHIETFPLQQLFDIVQRGRMSFQLKGIKLSVEKTDATVKADKILTLFMVNTIADNARKFTSEGGTVTVSATETPGYVEISVKDTGKGMTEEELSGIFDHKVYNGHGFGLMNCRGIIDKYKKISSIFNVCCLSAESELGKGSRFFFRLPKGMIRALLAICLFTGALLFTAIPSKAAGVQSMFSVSFPTTKEKKPTKASSSVKISTSTADTAILMKAAAFADSAYYSNINGTYSKTIAFSDSCRKWLNKLYLRHNPNGKLLMLKEGDVSKMPPEVRWLHDSLPTNYRIIMDVRNETAVAALALHQWALYRYNNKVYTMLFKEYSADNTLGEYCRMMQKSETNKNVAIAILILLLLSIFPAYYFIYYRHRVYYQYCVDKVRKINDILLCNSTADDKLKEIMPIPTDSFPTELRQVVEKIKHVLREAAERSRDSAISIELAEDERRRAEYEDQKLYVSNSVLDNCLSTLKHETMYYPSRIRQLVDGTDNNLSSIRELAEYYKELYTILSGQAMRQVDSVRLVCKPFPINEVLRENERGGVNFDLLGDKDLIGYLFEILRKQNGGKELKLSISDISGRYAVFCVLMPELSLNAEQCLQLFTPGRDRLPYLLCRQIARDNGEATNCRGCGITARTAENGTEIVITLTKAKKQ